MEVIAKGHHLEVRDDRGVDFLALGIELPAMTPIAFTDASPHEPGMNHLMNQCVLQLIARPQFQQRLAQSYNASATGLRIADPSASTVRTKACRFLQ